MIELLAYEWLGKDNPIRTHRQGTTKFTDILTRICACIMLHNHYPCYGASHYITVDLYTSEGVGVLKPLLKYVRTILPNISIKALPDLYLAAILLK